MTDFTSKGADKIKPHHRARDACVYIRQSTPGQVINNTESTRRQVDLRRRALALGWSAEQIRAIDDDQGQSADGRVDRHGFYDLMARVGAGEVGIILSLEISRLGRIHAELQGLYHLAALSDTLILDEAGVHDPKDSSDRLMLGIKSSVYEFELHGIRDRLYGGMRNKAERGDLPLILPTGLEYDPAGAVVLDPDVQVTEAITHVFEAFRRTRSAKATQTWLLSNGIRLPSRPLGAKRELVWSAARYSRVLSTLKNPRYAGCYVWGRFDRRRDRTGRTVFAPASAGRLDGLSPRHACRVHQLGGIPAQPAATGRKPYVPGAGRGPSERAAQRGGPATVAGHLRALRPADDDQV